MWCLNACKVISVTSINWENIQLLIENVFVKTVKGLGDSSKNQWKECPNKLGININKLNEFTNVYVIVEEYLTQPEVNNP